MMVSRVYLLIFMYNIHTDLRERKRMTFAINPVCFELSFSTEIKKKKRMMSPRAIYCHTFLFFDELMWEKNRKGREYTILIIESRQVNVELAYLPSKRSHDIEQTNREISFSYSSIEDESLNCFFRICI
jgi:hypothetical protein